MMMNEIMNGQDGEGFEGVEPATVAQFVHGSTSYIYIARISTDEMKAFLDTLAPEK